jgi:hypothetical protein
MASGAAQWTQITDYYTRFAPRGVYKFNQICIVVDGIEERIAGALRFTEGGTPAGALIERADRLKEIVREKSVFSRSRDWGVYGARDCDFPTEFRCPPSDPSKTARTLVWLAVFGVMVEVSWMLLPSLTGSSAVGATFGFWFAALFSAPVVIGAVYFLEVRPDARNWADFRGQVITISSDAITLDTDEGRTSIDWASVLDHYTTTTMSLLHGSVTQNVVCSESGELVFTRCIAEERLLRYIVSSLSINAVTTNWRATERSNGGIAATGSERGGEGAVYRSIHTYKTSSNRTTLAHLTLTLLIPAVCLGFLYGVGPPSPLPSDLICMFGVYVAAILAAWIAYARSYVMLDADGVTSRSLWRTRKIPWSEVQDVKFNDSGILGGLAVHGRHARIWVWSSLSDFELVRAAVEMHVGEGA